jgi:hypothetical protein
MKYEQPKLINLNGRSMSSEGFCMPGSGEATTCQSGNTAGGQCASGTNATGGSCGNGTYASGTCLGTGSHATGTCQNGNIAGGPFCASGTGI